MLFITLAIFTTKLQGNDFFSDIYKEDNSGLHLLIKGTTTQGNLWTLREYQESDFEDQWKIISSNQSSSDIDKKQYRYQVDAASRSSVEKRRARSLKRFHEGYPWGIMSLLDESGHCVLIVGLGRQTGSEGPARYGHARLGLTLDPFYEKNGYREAFLKTVTTQLAPEIRRIGTSIQVPEQIKAHFTKDLDQEEQYIDVGPLTAIDTTASIEQENVWSQLLESGFIFDTEEAIDLREETINMQNDDFQSLEQKIKEKFSDMIPYQRYLIMGPKGQSIVVSYNPKWKKIELCFVYFVPL